MKIGKINGTPQEIKNFLIDNGIQASDFLDLPRKIELKWLIIPASLFIIISFILWIINRPYSPIFILLVIMDLLTLGCLVASIHLKFKNQFVSILFFILLLIIFLMCVRFITLSEGINTIIKKINLRE